jgi:hypothetical protein
MNQTQVYEPTHEDLADAVERAIAAGKRCEAFKGNDMGPEANYEV